MESHDLASDILQLADTTITDRRKIRQVGRIFPSTGKASLNNPKSSSQPPASGAKVHTSAGSSWQIPRGVSKGNWDYVRANQIAEQYDRFLNDDPLTKVDWQIIDRYLKPVDANARDNLSGDQGVAPLVADLGCGTGRTLLPLLKRGYRGLAIDLSMPMLNQFATKSGSENAEALLQTGQLTLLNANLCELDGLKDNSIDHAICMFSTLGMITGSSNRASFLKHVRRVLKPGGLFIVHAHNVWFQLRSPGGIKWALGNFWSKLFKGSEFGDRTADYRGLRELFIHSFRKNELRRALVDQEFNNLTWHGVEPGAVEVTQQTGPGSSLRLVGWIVVCS